MEETCLKRFVRSLLLLTTTFGRQKTAANPRVHYKKPLGERIGYRNSAQRAKKAKNTQGARRKPEGGRNLTRMLHDDPSLDDIALALSSIEFHER